MEVYGLEIDNKLFCYTEKEIVKNGWSLDQFHMITSEKDLEKCQKDIHGMDEYLNNNMLFHIIKMLSPKEKINMTSVNKTYYNLIYRQGMWLEEAKDPKVLLWAIKINNKPLVTILLKNKTDIHYKNEQALMDAIQYGLTDIVKLLLENGADIHSQDDRPIDSLGIGGSKSKRTMHHIRWLRFAGPLISAIFYKHIDIVKLLLENGANVNVNNGNPLVLAAENGSTDIVKLLLEKGADIHTRDDIALIEAVTYNHIDIVKLLLENGANVHAQNDAALEAAEEDDYSDIVKLLVEYGANVHT